MQLGLCLPGFGVGLAVSTAIGIGKQEFWLVGPFRSSLCVIRHIQCHVVCFTSFVSVLFEERSCALSDRESKSCLDFFSAGFELCVSTAEEDERAHGCN